MNHRTSAKGLKFVTLQEGTILTAYLDAATPPVPTLGIGFTTAEPVVRRMIGKIVPGKTKITREKCTEVLEAIFAENIDPVVAANMPGAVQHEHDAAASGGYNLGVKRFMGWKWADLWRAGRKVEAWEYLGSHYNTAGGSPLAGLVRRRKEEALVGSIGFYTGIDGGAAPGGVARKATIAPKKAGPDPVIKEAQELLTDRGFNPGAIDGWMGEKTKQALLAYQMAHPHLVNDGVLGPATMAQLRRDTEAAATVIKGTIKTGGGGALGTGAAGAAASMLGGIDWRIVAGAAVVFFLAAAAFYIWQNRDIFMRRANTKRGKVVEV